MRSRQYASSLTPWQHQNIHQQLTSTTFKQHTCVFSKLSHHFRSVFFPKVGFKGWWMSLHLSHRLRRLSFLAFRTLEKIQWDFWFDNFVSKNFWWEKKERNLPWCFKRSGSCKNQNDFFDSKTRTGSVSAKNHAYIAICWRGRTGQCTLLGVNVELPTTWNSKGSFKNFRQQNVSIISIMTS